MADENDLSARIEDLRIQNRRLKWMGGLLTVFLVALILVVRAEDRKTVTANEFLLRDESGFVTAKLVNGTYGPCLALMTKDRVAGAELCVDHNGGSSLHLTADHGESRVLLSPGMPMYEGPDRLGPGMVIVSRADFVGVRLGEETQLELRHGENGSILLSVPSDRPRIELVDSKDQRVWRTP